MSFRWDQAIPDEREAGEPPPVWIYLVLFIIVECVALALTVATWPKGKSVNSMEFFRGVLLIGPVFWGAICAFIYHSAHGLYAFETAVVNQERWRQRRSWQQQGRCGVAVLDSVVLTPEPELAERMLGLDGTPPQNPGKVMALDMDETGAASRLHAVLEKLLVPLAPKLAGAMRSDSFLLMMQGDRDESSDIVRAVWKKLELPGAPRIVRMQAITEPKFAEKWFPADSDPYYRLVLAWHLNDGGPDAPKDCSEFAVALLLGSHQLMYNQRGKLKAQAWLLRGIATEADQAEDALTLLLRAEQVETKRIRNFWHSRLKGLARHATLGAVRESGLEVSTHALDTAIGPQAPVSRWLLYALAARMAHFGQGAQLVALPGEKGVAFSLVAREAQPVNLPWKDSYAYSIIPCAEIVLVCMSVLGVLLLDDSVSWNGLKTAGVVIVVVGIAGFFAERYFRSRMLAEEVWRVCHEGS
ncbi:hypothetical protein [Paraburkholderia domus]|jgi:hypothetical protein|uniref:Uncharacterized protein n=1 Tax=Paraburkholderia domus TaxID=2793075 RepID=A0A9N8MLG0_9BURK|nr:hypothetical protein [Paraburkholderia domus]MBK5049045.1 hypothetical protein [Burkholderia sp. R-70006]MBK5060015.1 hypothetical protein [Burkholderia sp. R-70199]MBK5118276.1 hypothetical protein [Burkholderia sp. R-69980]MBK5164115.1 hypothetical protein [Burkholderia sp. R-70211]MBK5179849.1 hypothetical protein [Burkholderia sp. R-69749]MCI0144363.1 hypothetical protein [Paraburkholderia sediminicola]